MGERLNGIQKVRGSSPLSSKRDGTRLARPVFVAALFLVATPTLAQDAAAPPQFEAAALEQRFKERLQPALEKVLGAPFKKPVRFRRTTQATLAQLIAKENEFLLAKIEGGPRGAELRAQCRQTADALAKGVFGKLHLEGDGVSIHPAAFRTMSRLTPAWRGVDSQPFLDVVLVHEAVHVYQQRRFNVRTFCGQPKTSEAVRCRFAVIEGHAQYVTRQVAKALGLQKEFALLVSVSSQIPKSITDRLQRLILQMANQFTSFPYVAGEAFFAHVAKKLGVEPALQRVFKQPPRTLREVNRPAEYLAPPTRRVDARKMAQQVSKLLDPAAYTVQVVEMGEGILKRALAPAGPKAAQVLKEFQAGAAAVASSKTRPGAQALVGMYHMSSEAGAAKLLAALVTVLKKKDAMFSGPGSVRITSAKYSKLTLEGVAGTYTDKVVQLRGMNPFHVRALVAQRGSLVLEVLYNLVPADQKSLEAIAKKVFAIHAKLSAAKKNKPASRPVKKP